jgi:ferredoxin, 2Fe-2S
MTTLMGNSCGTAEVPPQLVLRTAPGGWRRSVSVEHRGDRDVSDPAPVAKVHVKPSDVVISVQKGEPLMRAAERSGFHWPTICHGQAECTACWMEIDESAAFETATEIELVGLRLFEGRSFYTGKNIRLACQAHPISDTVVTKRGVRPITTVQVPMLGRRGTGRALDGDESGSPPALG